jgi:copper ion binding protein
MSTLTTAIYGVDGMTCGHCVQAVTNEVGAIAGVTDVSVDLTTGAVTVTSSEPLDPAEVHAAIDEAGYAVRA